MKQRINNERQKKKHIMRKYGLTGKRYRALEKKARRNKKAIAQLLQ